MSEEILMKELEPMLIQVAAGDLIEGADINDHPCMVIFRIAEDLAERLDAAERQISFMSNMMD